MAVKNSSAEIAAEQAGAEPKMVRVRLKASVEKHGFVYKPGLDHTMTEALKNEIIDAVESIDGKPV